MSGFCNVPAEDVALMERAFCKEETSTTSILDASMIIAENAMRRYVSQREAMVSSQNSEGAKRNAKKSAETKGTWYGALKAEAATTVRPFPYASLFLYPLPEELSEFPHAPPAFLLAKSAAKPVPVSFPEEEGFRAMSMLDGGSPSMVTVLQGECGLALTDGPPVFIMSPDATSCTIVACRVGLHPALRKKIASRVSQDSVDDDHARMLPSLLRCAAVFTAAMSHVDSVDDVEIGLHDALWEGALPAWLHAVHGTTECPLHELLARLQKLHEEPECMDATGETLLMVEWFVMGSIRMRDGSPLHMSAIIRAFFAPNVSDTPRPVLSPSIPLSAALSASPSAPDMCLTLSHHLREDGLCFWSLNTMLRPWALGKRGERYACAASWGMLLNVASGACWPAALQPGTRTYPLEPLRNVPNKHWAWLFPLRREASLRVSRASVVAERAAVRFGMRLWSEESGMGLTLAEFVTEFLQRLHHMREEPKREEEEEEEMERGKEVRPLPLLLRITAWDKAPLEGVDDLPDFCLLTASTTPHCEPPDFAELVRKQLKLMSEFASDEIFPPRVAGIFI